MDFISTKNTHAQQPDGSVSSKWQDIVKDKKWFIVSIHDDKITAGPFESRRDALKYADLKHFDDDAKYQILFGIINPTDNKRLK